MYGALVPAPAARRRADRARRARRQARRARRDALGRPAAPARPRARRSSATPTCSSSTSRRPASTRPPGARRGRRSARCATLGKTVFLTTHFMDEAQALADRVAVMVAGEIVAIGPPDELGGRDALPAEIRFALPPAWTLRELPPTARRRRSSDGARRRARHDARAAWPRPTRSPAGRSSAASRCAASPSPSRPSRTSTWRSRPASPRRRCDDRRESDLARDLALVAWQVRYEQRAFWRNRRRGVLHVRVPADVPGHLRHAEHGQHVDTRGGISVRSTSSCPASSPTAIVADRVLEHWRISSPIAARQRRAQAHARHAAAVVGVRRRHGSARRCSIVAADRRRCMLASASLAFGVARPASHAARARCSTLVLGTACFTALGIGVARLIPKRRERHGRSSVIVVAAADVHLEHLVPARRHARLARRRREGVPAPAAGGRAAGRVRPAHARAPGIVGARPARRSRSGRSSGLADAAVPATARSAALSAHARQRRPTTRRADWHGRRRARGRRAGVMRLSLVWLAFPLVDLVQPRPLGRRMALVAVAASPRSRSCLPATRRGGR